MYNFSAITVQTGPIWIIVLKTGTQMFLPYVMIQDIPTMGMTQVYSVCGSCSILMYYKSTKYTRLILIQDRSKHMTTVDKDN